MSHFMLRTLQSTLRELSAEELELIAGGGCGFTQSATTTCIYTCQPDGNVRDDEETADCIS